MLKAGSAGSNPDGATKKKIETSHALSLFLMDVGDAVFILNTLVVGLDAVEKGHQKPETLDISWKPADLIAAARKSRKFALEAVIVRVSEALSEFTNAISKLPRCNDIRSRWDGDTSDAIKVDDIARPFMGDDYLISGAALLVHWRNRVVHRSSNAKLTPGQKRALQANDAEIAEKYKGLSIDRLLCHFEEKRPTLKDVSSLIAMCINLTRRIDQEIQMNLSETDLNAWLEYYGLTPIIRRVTSETSPDKREASIRRVFQSHAPLLLAPYLHYHSI